MSRLHRSAINVAMGAAGFVVPMAINVVATPLLLRELGEAAFGLQTLVSVITGYMLVMDVGLDIPITKFVAEYTGRDDSEAARRLLRTTLHMYLLIGAAGVATIIGGAEVLARRVFIVPPNLFHEAHQVFVLTGVGFGGAVLTSWGRAVVNGLQRYDISNGISIANTAVGTGFGLLAVHLGHGVVGFVAFRVMFLCLAGIAYIATARRLAALGGRWLGFHREVWRNIRGYAASGLLFRLSGVATAGLDRTLLAAFVGVAAAGVYSVPLMIVTSVYYLILSMIQFIFPMVSELSGANRYPEVRQVHMRAMLFVNALACLAFPLLIALGDRLLFLWVGPRIAEAGAPVLRVLAIATFGSILSVGVLINVVVGLGHMRAFSAYIVTRAVVMSAVYATCIPRFGLMGGGLGYLAGAVVDIGFSIVGSQRYVGINWTTTFRASFGWPLVLGVGTGAIAYAMHPIVTSWPTLISFCIVISLGYGAAAFGVGMLGQVERQAFASVWGTFVQKRVPKTS